MSVLNERTKTLVAMGRRRQSVVVKRTQGLSQEEVSSSLLKSAEYTNQGTKSSHPLTLRLNFMPE